MPRSKNEKGDIKELLRDYKDAIEVGNALKERAVAEAIEFGRYPREGKHFVRNILGNALVEEADGTPYTCSVASETYHCS